MGKFSLVCVNDVLIVIQSDDTYFALNTETSEQYSLKCDKPNYLSYPSITDGKFIYCFQADSYKARVFEVNGNGTELSFVRTVTFQDNYVKNDPIMATNGIFISFITTRNDETICSVNSLIDGRHINDATLTCSKGDPVLYSWTFDAVTLSHICLTSDGLLSVSGPSSVPPWLLDIPIPDLSKFRDSVSSPQAITEAFLMHFFGMTIHYIGGSDFPFSVSDPTAAISLCSLIDTYTTDIPQNISVLHGLLIALQVKVRSIRTVDEQCVRVLSKFFDETNPNKAQLQQFRKHAAFVLLSIFEFIRVKSDKIQTLTKILELIAREKSCAVIMLLTVDFANISVDVITEQLINYLMQSFLKLPKSYANRVICALENIYDKVFDDYFNKSHAIQKYEKFVLNLFSMYNESLIVSKGAKISDDQFFSSPTCVMTYRIISKIFQQSIPITLNISNNVYGLSLAQTIVDSHNVDRRHSDIFMKCMFITFRYYIRQVLNNTKFIQHVPNEPVHELHHNITSNQKSAKEYINSSTDFSVSDLHDLIQNLTASPIESKSTSFYNYEQLISTLYAEKDHKILLSKIAQIEAVKPQPVRRIINYLMSDKAEFVVCSPSSLQQFIDTVRYFKGASFSDYTIIYNTFQPLLNEVYDDILYASPDLLKRVLDITPTPLILPPQVLTAINYSFTDSEILSLKVDDLVNSKSQIIACAQNLQTKELLQPLLSTHNLVSISETGLYRSLTLAQIALSKKDASPSIIPFMTLKRLLPFVSERCFYSLLELFELIFQKNAEVPNSCDQMIAFLFDVMTKGIFNDHTIFKKHSEIAYYRLIFAIVDTFRKLIKQNNRQIIDYFSVNMPNFTEEQKLGFFCIAQNTMNCIRKGSSVRIVLRNNEIKEGKILSISVDGRKIMIDTNEVIELRHCLSVIPQNEVFSPENIQINHNLIDLYQNYNVNSPLGKVLYLSSLLSFLETGQKDFIDKITVEKLLSIIKNRRIEPENRLDFSIFYFYNCYFRFNTQNMPLFQFTSLHATSAIKSVTQSDDSYHIEGEMMSVAETLCSSPILTSTESTISIVLRDTKKAEVELSIQGPVRQSTASLFYSPLTFTAADNDVDTLCIQFDPVLMKINVVCTYSNNTEAKTVLQMFPSVEFHYIKLNITEGKYHFSADLGTKLVQREQNAFANLTKETIPRYTESAVLPILPYSEVFHTMLLEEITNSVSRSLRHKICTILYKYCLPVDEESAYKYFCASIFSNNSNCEKICELVCREKPEYLSYFYEKTKDFSGFNGFIVSKDNKLAIPVPENTIMRKPYMCISENKRKEDENIVRTTTISLFINSNDLRETYFGQKILLDWSKSHLENH